MRRFLTFLGVGALCWWGLARFSASSDQTWRALDDSGIQTRVLTRKTAFSTVSISAFRAPASRVRLNTGAYLEAAQWQRKSGARVVINGGYFDGKGQPLGLRIARGERQNRLRKADWGVFSIFKNRAQISHTKDFSSQNSPDEAIQCGPRLVVNGRVTDLKKQWGRRTGIGIDRQGRVILAVSDGELTLGEWAKIFADADALNCPNALNLDGGGSTQLAVKDRDDLAIGGAWPVPDVMEIR